MNEEKIIKHLIRLEDKIDNVDLKIDREIGSLRNEMNDKLDGILVIVQRLDQERIFTQRWIQRLEEDVKQQDKEIKLIKKVLKIA